MAPRIDVKEPPAASLQPINPQNVAGSLTNLYTAILLKAEAALEWYREARTIKKRWSSGLRIIAILLFSITGLIPVLKAAGISWDPKISVEFGQIGAVTAALAAAVLGLDKFFGFSSGWMRYTMADSNIRRAMAEFQMNWIIANSCLENDPEEQTCAKKRLSLLRDFSLKVTSLIDDETRQWVLEFQGSISMMDKGAQGSNELTQTGSISVAIDRGVSVNKEVNITLDGESLAPTQASVIVLPGITPGPHSVAVSGTRQDGGTIRDSKTVTVSKGATAVANLRLDGPD